MLMGVAFHRRSYSIPMHLVPTNFISTLCQILLLFTRNLLEIQTTFLQIIINENKYLESDIEFIKITPNSLGVIRLEGLD